MKEKIYMVSFYDPNLPTPIYKVFTDKRKAENEFKYQVKLLAINKNDEAYKNCFTVFNARPDDSDISYFKLKQLENGEIADLQEFKELSNTVGTKFEPVHYVFLNRFQKYSASELIELSSTALQLSNCLDRADLDAFNTILKNFFVKKAYDFADLADGDYSWVDPLLIEEILLGDETSFPKLLITSISTGGAIEVLGEVYDMMTGFFEKECLSHQEDKDLDYSL